MVLAFANMIQWLTIRASELCLRRFRHSAHDIVSFFRIAVEYTRNRFSDSKKAVTDVCIIVHDRFSPHDPVAAISVPCVLEMF